MKTMKSMNTKNTLNRENRLGKLLFHIKKLMFIGALCSIFSLQCKENTKSEGYTLIITKDAKNRKISSEDFLFNEQLFFDTIQKVFRDAEKGLKHYYGTDSVKITIHDWKRDLEKQEKVWKNKKSKTPLSLHNFGGAVDIRISLNGETQSGTTPKTALPYRIVGRYVQNAGFFRGRDGDIGHIGATETLTEFFSQYGGSLKNPTYSAMIKNIISSDSLPVSLQPFYKKFHKEFGLHKEPFRIPNTLPEWGYMQAVNPYEKE